MDSPRGQQETYLNPQVCAKPPVGQFGCGYRDTSRLYRYSHRRLLTFGFKSSLWKMAIGERIPLKKEGGIARNSHSSKTDCLPYIPARHLTGISKLPALCNALTKRRWVQYKTLKSSRNLFQITREQLLPCTAANTPIFQPFRNHTTDLRKTALGIKRVSTLGNPAICIATQLWGFSSHGHHEPQTRHQRIFQSAFMGHHGPQCFWYVGGLGSLG